MVYCCALSDHLDAVTALQAGLNEAPDHELLDWRKLLLPTENPRANVLAPPQRKMKRADFVLEHKVSPRPSTFSRKDDDHAYE